MESFIFEDQLEKVKSEKIKIYLFEVLSTYNNKEYRSCIVMLYAVTFIDFLEKAKLLSELYQDPDATKFLNDYKIKRNQNTKYSALESMVINFVIKKGMLNDVELKQWEHLKDYRDQCAHPVVSLNLELISPNREQVRAHIRNMFEAIFLKDAILHGQVFDEFIKTIENYYDRNKLDRFDDFFKARYLSRLDLATKQLFFKKLWKFCYQVQEIDCITYRKVAYNALIMIINSDRTNLINFFEKERDYFNGNIYFDKIDIDKSDSDIKLYNYSSTSLLYLLFKVPELVDFMTRDNIEELKNTAYKNINFLLISYYLFKSSSDHIDALKREISPTKCLNRSIVEIVWKQAFDKFDNSYFDFIIYYFFHCQNSPHFSPDYEYINSTYTNILQSVLPSFSELQIDNFLGKLNYTYMNANCFNDLAVQIYDIITKNGYSIDFSSHDINIELIVQASRKTE